MTPTEQLAEYSADPKNSTRARLTDTERADYDAMAGGGANRATRDEALQLIGRSDLIPPKMPALKSNGAYVAADLIRFMAAAHRRGMKADAISRALKAPIDRVHYFMSRDGKKALERQAAKEMTRGA